MENAKKELDTVSEVLLGEFEKFKAEKAVDIKQLLANFARMQMDYHKKAEKIWSDVLPLLMANEASAAAGTYKQYSAPPPVPPMPPAPPGGSNPWSSKGDSGFREEDEEVVDV